MADDTLIAKYLLDKDGNFRKIKNKNGKEILILEKPEISDALYRSSNSFNADTKVTIKDSILSIFNSKARETKEAKRLAEAVSTLSSIIWKYKSSKSEWDKQLKQAGIKPEEANASLDSRKIWFAKNVLRRIDTTEDGKRKKLYNIFKDNKDINNYYKLDSDSGFDNIKNDVTAQAILYSRFKTGKEPTDAYWSKKLPAQLAKLGKDNDIDGHIKAIYGLYNILKQYIRKNINGKANTNKSDWQAFLKENERQLIKEAIKVINRSKTRKL